MIELNALLMAVAGLVSYNKAFAYTEMNETLLETISRYFSVG